MTHFALPSGRGLTVADTGISGICYTSVPRDKVPAQDKVLEEIEDQLTDKTSEAYLAAESGAVFRARLGDDGDVVYERLVTSIRTVLTSFVFLSSRNPTGASVT